MQLTKEKDHHIPVLDNLRAIAAFSVCLYHFVVGPIHFIENKTILQVFGFGKYGVQLFFVISGFIIPWSIARSSYTIRNYFRFLLKRFIRLEPPYLVSILLVLILYWLRKYYTDLPDARNFQPEQVLLHIGYLIPFSNYDWIIDVYWTLAIEFQFYLFMALFFFVITSRKMPVRVLGYIVVLGLSFIGNKEFLPFWFPVFLLGNMLFLWITERIGKGEFWGFSILVCLVLGIFYPLPILVSSLVAFIGILFFYNYSNRLLAWLGKISYSVYLVHTIIGTALINFLSHRAHSSFAKSGVIVIGLLVTIGCSYLMYRLVEGPAKRWSSRIKYSKNDRKNPA
jgi:peptidoglycan/LPS O-acetylase OafA/YrhL